MAASAAAKKLTLKSSDGQAVAVDVAVAMASQTIKHMVEDGCADNIIPLPNVTAKILSKVIEYCKKHVQASPKPADSSAAADANSTTSTAAAAPAEDLKSFDAEFIKVDQITLVDLILAAHYLNIKGLLDLTCTGGA